MTVRIIFSIGRFKKSKTTSQKIAFLPAGTDPEIVKTFSNAFAKIAARPDFAEISAKRLGKYPMYTGDAAKSALGNATTVSDSAKAYVVDWLKADFGVELKK